MCAICSIGYRMSTNEEYYKLCILLLVHVYMIRNCISVYKNDLYNRTIYIHIYGLYKWICLVFYF